MEGGANIDLSGALQSTVDTVVSNIASVLPLAASVFAIAVGVNYAFKLFKRITGTRS